ncbi:MFS transporter [Solirubrobacter sp. CPCC 204708]|uniref:MFS transporter n=1 Tax=Solirubrobacter deserti TaxID=2282478 RepID=A0ABT4REE7_9ACTN|nr:MFS transporter [Solirubrobacter deserti]MDA0136731.1 MFS transporter [Solirubrobacter deserti]
MTRSRTLLLLVLSGAIFLEGVDVSMMGVALPSIREELGLATSELQWIVSAYVLGYGGFVLLGGRAADLLGRRRMFLSWMAVFIVFSALGGIADSGWLLILARFVTGVAAGFMAPAGLSIITSSFAEGSERNRALLIYAGVAAAGFSLGMVVGGLLTAIGWRWVFFAPVAMASLLMLAAMRVVPRDAERAAGAFDLSGALSLTAAMILLVFTVVRAPDVDVALTVVGLVGSAALLAAFVAVERRAAAPLVRLGILRSASLVRANVGTMLFIGAFVAFQFVAVLYLQELRDWSPVETGLALMVLGIDAILAPTLTPRLVERFGKLPVIGAGMVLAAVGYGLFLPLGPDWTYLQMLPTIVLVGVAFALAFGTLMIVATDGIAEHEQGLASGLQYVSLQFGAAVGLAVVAAVNVAATDGTSEAARLDGYQAALFVPVAAVLLALAVTATALPESRRASVIGACSST